jgi:hypothetical protein
MKLVINFYNNLKVKPSHRFFINLFFFKNNYFFLIKQLQYISVIISLRKIWKIKIFKFNYSFYFYFILTFLFVNLLLQVLSVIN